jgi:hypothetical protein
MCIPTAILTPRLGNNFSLNIAENINPISAITFITRGHSETAYLRPYSLLQGV